MNALLTRRALLAAGAAGAAFSTLAGPAGPRAIRAAPASVRLTPADAPLTEVWAYDGAAPGPELRFRRGDRLAATLFNDLPQPTTIHWHGIRSPNAMDGVPGLTQDPVGPAENFDYAFDLTDAGTYWYHSHLNGWEQVARGLHGPLIVDEAAPPDVDRDITLTIDDWRLDQNAQIAGGFGGLHDWSHAGRIGNWITVNGAADFRLAAKRGERLRLRLINAANARIFSLSLRGLEGSTVAVDGQPLTRPQPIGRVTLAPAQRVDLIVDVTAEEEALIISYERDGAFALASFPVGGAVKARGSAIAPLEPNDAPALGPTASARRARLTMEGGAMGGMAEARLGGEVLPIRDLARRGKAWAFNGRADPPEAPLFHAALNETVIIEMANDTRWPHAIHLHGHHFRRLGVDGAIGPLRDTILTAPGEQVRIAFLADNPGAWLLHCHMLEHSAAGMSTWIEVG